VILKLARWDGDRPATDEAPVDSTIEHHQRKALADFVLPRPPSLAAALML